jgi:hypothetical protein
MSSLYSDHHRALQQACATTGLAEMLGTGRVHEQISDHERAFITSRDTFFLSTVDPDGNPTVSYKGGPTGFVKVLDAHTRGLPGYCGNGRHVPPGGQYRRPVARRPAVHRFRETAPRHVHRYRTFEQSKYVPKAECTTPLASCKRLDVVQDVLP